ncbi:unnamed protein product, partial [Rotaria sordida]
ADVDKTVEAAQTAFDIESPWRNLDPLSFSQHKSICKKWKHLTMLIVLKPTEQTPLSALYCAALIEEIGKKIQEAATKSNLKFVTLERGQDKLECVSERVDNKGCFIKATIFSDVIDDMQITREEIFGPIMLVLKYDSYEEVIKRANDTTFELGAGVITRDIRRALALAHQIRPDSIWINTYKAICNQVLFDGFKESGQEKELGRYGLEAYYQSDPDKAIEAAEKGFQYDSPWLDVPVRTAHRALFTHAGQVCFAASRIFIHSTLHDAFVSKSVELAKKRIVGDPFDSSTEQGP